MSAMSVIGIDLGNESSYVAVAKAGGIETIANDYSMRNTPTCIAFSEKNRILGVAAKAQQVTNMQNTVFGMKRLVGRLYSDPYVQNELQFMQLPVVEDPVSGKPLINVSYMGAHQQFTPEQCLAMFLTKLKETAHTALQSPINDCVISVPSYFTNNERRAVLEAATIADLNVLRLFNETTATALAYGIYKQDLPAGADEKSRNVVFVDCGYASLQVSVCAFNKDRLRMIATASDPHLGGRNFDAALAEHFCQEFQKNYQLNVHRNPRAYLRLLAEVEKIKKQMSANSTVLPLNIECFMNDRDVQSKIKRSDFEQLCTLLFDRMEHTMQHCLDQSGLTADEVYSVEIVGGSTRIPEVKRRIEKVFGKAAYTSLNQDEAVSRGCALQCAMLSPAIRVRDFNVKDLQPYAISVCWTGATTGTTSDGGGELEAFPVNHAVPFSKMFTFYRSAPFTLRAIYTGQVPYPDCTIGNWVVKNVTPDADGKPQKVKVKVRINLHGMMTVAGASMFESKECAVEMAPAVNNADEGGSEDATNNKPLDTETMNGDSKHNSETAVNDNKPQAGAAAENSGSECNDATMADATAPGSQQQQQPSEDGGDKDNLKKKHVVKSVELPVEQLSPNNPTATLSQTQLNQFTELEGKMIAADRQEKERANARNALEEYVYDLRSKLSGEEGEFVPYILDAERQQLVQELDNMENWLYEEEGEACNKAVYVEKLSALKSRGEPIQSRRLEFTLSPIAIEDFAKSLQICTKSIGEVRDATPKYAHLTNDDLETLTQHYQSSYNWLEKARQKCGSSPKHLPPPFTVAQIRQEKVNFDSAIQAVLSKPPPKPPSPPKEDKPSADSTAATDKQSAPPSTTQSETTGAAATNPQNNCDNSKPADNMDWSNN